MRTSYQRWALSAYHILAAEPHDSKLGRCNRAQTARNLSILFRHKGTKLYQVVQGRGRMEFGEQMHLLSGASDKQMNQSFWLSGLHHVTFAHLIDQQSLFQYIYKRHLWGVLNTEMMSMCVA